MNSNSLEHDYTLQSTRQDLSPIADEPLLSIIVITYNRASLLELALSSILIQSLENIEILVIDDGSTDETSQILEKFSDRVRVVRQENLGEAAARNRGIDEARGCYIGWLDSDDLMFPWSLDTYRRAIFESSDASVIGLSVRSFSEESDISDEAFAELSLATANDFYSGATRERFIHGLNHTLVRRKLLLEVGGISRVRANATDSDCLMRIGDAPGFARIHQPTCIAYRKHPGSIMLDDCMAERGAMLLISQEKHGRYPGGASRRAERLDVLLPRIRAVAVQLAKNKKRWSAIKIFGRTLGMHLRQRQFRFLLGFPLLLLHPHPERIDTSRG